jgi:hypothetical protein
MDAHSIHELGYLDKATGAFWVTVMCEAAPTSVCFDAAKSWAHHADSNHHESVLNTYCAVIELLLHLAILGLDLQSCQQALTSSDGLACDAQPVLFNLVGMTWQSSYSKKAVQFFGHRCCNFVLQ